MKRSLKIIGACLALSLMLSGCGAGNGGQPSENEQEKVCLLYTSVNIVIMDSELFIPSRKTGSLAL